MVVAEAAAFGVPAMVHGGPNARVGVCELLPVGDASFCADYSRTATCGVAAAAAAADRGISDTENIKATVDSDAATAGMRATDAATAGMRATDAATALVKVLKDADARRKVSARARELSLSWDEDAHSRALEKIFRLALDTTADRALEMPDLPLYHVPS
jgi:hypothetical protein